MPRIVRMKTVHGHEEFRLRVWKKKVYVMGWHANLKIGSREWSMYPSKRSEQRQLAQARGEI